MRRYGIANPYEQLKALTRGTKVDEKTLRQFVSQLAIPDEAKQRLMAMTPANYLGVAASLAKNFKK
jgi:adenylosuccinate lyase